MDSRIIKTHHPALRLLVNELDKYTGRNKVCGIILMNRSDTLGWCRRHYHERKLWSTSNETMLHCPQLVSSKFEQFIGYYKNISAAHGIPIAIFDYSEMATNATFARMEFVRLFNFTKMEVSPERFELASRLHIQGY